MKCPCHSGMFYVDCCKPYHEGLFAENALKLMRSRYSAYALMNVDYIIRTTHPENPTYTVDFTEWKKEIRKSYQNTQFVDLKILEFTDGKETAFVTFTAVLKREGQDLSFTERSTFLKVGEFWLYKDGVIKKT